MTIKTATPIIKPKPAPKPDRAPKGNVGAKTGQRFSRQREQILKIVLGTKSHPTADWVYDQVRLKIPSVSLGTVYRNLNLLADDGKITRVILEDGKVRFDGNTGEHYHFICTNSGKVIDLDGKFDASLLEKFNRKTGMNATACKIEFYGKL
ncbi:MAG: transcriptional repressor [Rhizobacter sp.]|nr:transcriptional repressor [Chlorobiales bacterium]